jgi:hypothetical protein
MDPVLESGPTITENWVKYEKVTFTPMRCDNGGM